MFYALSPNPVTSFLERISAISVSGNFVQTLNPQPSTSPPLCQWCPNNNSLPKWQGREKRQRGGRERAANVPGKSPKLPPHSLLTSFRKMAADHTQDDDTAADAAGPPGHLTKWVHHPNSQTEYYNFLNKHRTSCEVICMWSHVEYVTMCDITSFFNPQPHHHTLPKIHHLPMITHNPKGLPAARNAHFSHTWMMTALTNPKWTWLPTKMTTTYHQDPWRRTGICKCWRQPPYHHNRLTTATTTVHRHWQVCTINHCPQHTKAHQWWEQLWGEAECSPAQTATRAHNHHHSRILGAQ